MNEPTAPAQRILVDIDSTLYPSDPIFIRAMRERHGLELRLRDLDEWDWWRRYITLDDFLALIRIDFHANDEITGAVPFTGAVEALREWRATGAKIHIVSDRHPRTARATRAWLASCGIEADAIVLRSPIDKIAYAQAHRIDLVIDDRPSTLVAAREAGIRTATLIYPYNRLLLAGAPDIIRAANWRVLRRRIEADAARLVAA